MQEAMFTGLFGAMTAEYQMNNIANNLANVNTNGYKRDVLAFRDTMIQFAHDQIMEPMANIRSKPLFPEPQLAARVRIAVADTDFEQGSMQVTGNPLDMAITGEGFFRFETPRGTYLSRNGAFVADANGRIVTKQGWPVLDEGGNAIAIPAGTRNLHIDYEGRVYADEAQVGQIGLVKVDDTKNLEKLGHNMYKARTDVPITQTNAYEGERGARLNQGYLEAANVEVVSEMVNMIQAHRYFEAMQKTMQASDSVDREAITKVGRPR